MKNALWVVLGIALGFAGARWGEPVVKAAAPDRFALVSYSNGPAEGVSLIKDVPSGTCWFVVKTQSGVTALQSSPEACR